MSIIKVALSHFCCRTTVQSDSVSVSSQAGDSSSLVDSSRNILSVSRKGRLEQHSLQFPSEDRKRRRILNQLRQSVPCSCSSHVIQVLQQYNSFKRRLVTRLVTGPCSSLVWNSLPSSVITSETLGTFRCWLKAHLFALSLT